MQANLKNYSPTADRNQIRAYLELYQKAAEGRQGVRAHAFIEPQKHKDARSGAPISFKYKPTSFEDMITDISHRCVSSNVYGHHALINPSFQAYGHSKVADADILSMLGLVSDSDVDNGKPAKLIDGIEPSLIVQTSGENQQISYVFSRPVTVQEFRELAELLYRKCGGDPCCKVPSQLFRIPGTPNYPDYKKIERGRDPAPYPVHIVGGSMKLIDPDKLRSALGKMPDLNPQSVRAGGGDPDVVVDVDTGLAQNFDVIVAKIPEFVQHLMRQHVSDDRSAHCHRVMLALFESGLTTSEVFAVANGAAFAKKWWDHSKGESRLIAEIKRIYKRWTDKGRFDATRTPAYVLKAMAGKMGEAAGTDEGVTIEDALEPRAVAEVELDDAVALLADLERAEYLEFQACGGQITWDHGHCPGCQGSREAQAQ